MNTEAVTFLAMTESEAERVTEQIAFRIDSITDNYEVVMTLMRDALARSAHQALGYASPGAYIADRFGKSLQMLSSSLRREFVHELADAGLSTRAIAPVFGISKTTVHRDIESPVPHGTPDPTVTLRDQSDTFEVDGMTVTKTGEVLDDVPEVVEHTFTEKVKTTVGLDGKTYTQKPREPKPALDGDAAIQQNAEQACLNIGRGLSELQRFEHQRQRDVILNDWWPRAKDTVTPLYTCLFNSGDVRNVADALYLLAADMEAHNEYK